LLQWVPKNWGSSRKWGGHHLLGLQWAPKHWGRSRSWGGQLYLLLLRLLLLWL
jgi:hypothetical protein